VVKRMANISLAHTVPKGSRFENDSLIHRDSITQVIAICKAAGSNYFGVFL
jgi:hypothetical protein